MICTAAVAVHPFLYVHLSTMCSPGPVRTGAGPVSERSASSVGAYRCRIKS